MQLEEPRVMPATETARPATLTQDERDTLNVAMDIILAHTAPGASWSISAYHWHGSTDYDVTYFDSQRDLHSRVEGARFGDKIATALALEESDEVKEAARAERVASLKRQLAELTGEAA